ncbi:hypothetical protein [Polaromonas sp. JS666]|uniref:hypothetical protein n=1 Tax=Polaromonas sp. (strain JS666 / ATCC BAA-500) TaxID=296591 RepID=UPI0000464666|nr:hypothetical protein [Polaromonas sp. JS666]ABE47267.1 hypothetical protein Bpro_5413 [Polaromonas sp. JS666]
MTVITNHKFQKHWAALEARAAPAPGVAAKSSHSLRPRLVCCTLTGIDAGVPFETLQEVSRRHSYVEFGVLYSTSKQGKGQYPSLSWISKLALQAQEQPGVRLALHVCGGAVEDLLTGQGHVTEVAAAFPCILIKRLESREGYTIEGAAAALKTTEQWVHERIQDGTIRVTRAKWDRRRLYITEPMIQRLKEALARPRREKPLSKDWLMLNGGAAEAGVCTTTLIRWAEAGDLPRRQSNLGWRYHREDHREAVRAQARVYWENVRFHRATPPEWLQAEIL